MAGGTEDRAEPHTLWATIKYNLSYREAVYEFPSAAITKYHKLSGLKQQNIILSQLWGWKTEIKMSARPCSL